MKNWNRWFSGVWIIHYTNLQFICYLLYFILFYSRRMLFDNTIATVVNCHIVLLYKWFIYFEIFFIRWIFLRIYCSNGIWMCKRKWKITNLWMVSDKVKIKIFTTVIIHNKDHIHCYFCHIYYVEHWTCFKSQNSKSNWLKLVVYIRRMLYLKH